MIADINDDHRIEAPDPSLPGGKSAFWQTFHHGTAVVDGLHLHYVEGGSGPPIVLLPGWPQSWYAWRLVMPRLVAAGHRVIAVDPRGIGDSDRPLRGYDLKTAAADIHGLAKTLGLLADGPIDMACHDVGTWIGYAYAADWPDDVRRLAVMDALVPGLSASRTDLSLDEANLRSWHFAFNRLDDLPELLIAGREHAFLTWLFRAKAVNPWAIGPDDIDEYARQLAAPGAIRAATAYYKEAFSPEGFAANQARSARPLAMPVLALGAERGVGPGLVDAMRALATDVQGGVVADCGHYMPEERPEEVSDELIRFFTAGQPRPAPGRSADKPIQP
jgi:pimeloyl-ACP methyl ester carboxylesterase